MSGKWPSLPASFSSWSNSESPTIHPGARVTDDTWSCGEAGVAFAWSRWLADRCVEVLLLEEVLERRFRRGAVDRAWVLAHACEEILKPRQEREG